MFLCGAFSALPLINARAKAALDEHKNNQYQSTDSLTGGESE